MSDDVSTSVGLIDPDIDAPLPEPGQLLHRSFSSPYHVATTALRNAYINVLLVFAPLGIAAGAAGWPPVAVFPLNFLAIIPLAALIAFSTKKLSASARQAVGGLLRAFSRNAVLLIIGIIAVNRGQIDIAQSSLMGSILYDSLLILGGSCFFAGYGRERAEFNKTMTNIMSSLMMAGSVTLIIPTTMASTILASDTTGERTNRDVLILSHGIAVILSVLFALYLYFQLNTHARLFHGPPNNGRAMNRPIFDSRAVEEHRSLIRPWAIGCILVGSLGLAIICSIYLVDAVDGLSVATGVSKNFISLVFIPVACSTAKCVAIANVPIRESLDYVMRIIIGSVLQIVLFITPCLIFIGWIVGQQMVLSFDIFEATVLFITIMMNYIIQSGRTNYFEGSMLMGTYVIIAVAFFVRTDPTGHVIVPRL